MDLFRKGLRRLVHILGENKLISSKTTMTWLHTIELGRKPDLKRPRDLNEKLIWMEFNTDTREWSRLADKYEVRKYIEEKGFKDSLIPLIGIYETLEELDFEVLPEDFVIKSTNGCEQTIIVKDKSKQDIAKIREEIKGWQKKPFGLATGETHYLRIKPRIIVESLLPLKDNTPPIDYKFYCFQGKVHSCLIVSNRNFEKHSYRLNLIEPQGWIEIPNAIKPPYIGCFESVAKPVNLNEMIEMAEKISQPFPFVRVDLYNIDGKIYFGEMTFTPAGGRPFYMTTQCLEEMGNLIKQ